ncbi:MAG: bifunctional phosphoribosylaminoimidazolecarboxamide formyltransferase/IMP cyclohydrolase [Pantoea sp. Brub]|nr:bifunctional phosphoribosylaminoimidazolecarboxamide formyltransferase/IMP cyclohydrolase [Pantoea sp. Brub]
MQLNRPIRNALISVFDKTNIVEFAKKLYHRNIKLISTGGTANLLINSGLPVIEVSSYTEFPEILDGRVKTLHPKIHGGILNRREYDEAVIAKHSIFPIDIVVVNFYPFEKIIDNQKCLLSDAIENIDIGGPAMVSGAAKNYKDVTIIVDSKDYNYILNKLDQHDNSLRLETRFKLAIKAFKYVADYNNMIANYFYNLTNKKIDNNLPNVINLKFIKEKDMRYGENNHQKSAFYIQSHKTKSLLADLKQIQGKILSYNNMNDSDTALECIKEFNDPACVIVKHANPCGVAVNNSVVNAYQNAYKSDPISAFGGVIALNRELDLVTVQTILNNQFFEVLLVPSVTQEALDIIKFKKNVRLLIYNYNQWQKSNIRFDFKNINGGLLVQQHDNIHIQNIKFSVVSKFKPTKQELNDAIFSWKVVKFVKSNAIVYAKNNTTIAIGSGQMSRVDSVNIANMKAKHLGFKIKGCTIASDAFFPFRDCIDIVGKIGVKCIIQPGGSIRDQEIISAANEYNIAMIFTHIRHFRH